MRRTKQEARQTREAILDAAEALFFDRGVASTTLTQIAEAAGLTRGAIYWHFDNKLALFLALQERARLPQEEFFDEHEDDSPRSLDDLFANTLEALRFLKENDRARRVLTILLFRCEYVGEMQPAMIRRTDADQAMQRCLVRIFESVRGCGGLRAELEPREAATAYVCAVSGVISEWLRSDFGFDIEVVGRRVVAGVIAAFACPTRRPACLDEAAEQGGEGVGCRAARAAVANEA